MLGELRAYFDGIMKKLEKELSEYMVRQYKYEVQSKESAAEIKRLNGRVKELENALAAKEEETKDLEDQNKALQAHLNNNSENLRYRRITSGEKCRTTEKKPTEVMERSRTMRDMAARSRSNPIR